MTLELGGKSAELIFPDASLDQAVKGRGRRGSFSIAGQVCSAGLSELLVVEELLDDEVVERLHAARANAIRVGDPRDKATSMGPLVSAVQMQRVLDYIDVG